MPITVTRHMCAKCGSLHTEFSSAVRCENLPIVGLEVQPGTVLGFDAETQSITRWNYQYESGTVIGNLIVFCNSAERGDHHRTMVVVSCKRGNERLLALGDQGNWYSAHDWDHPAGFYEESMRLRSM